MDDRLNRIWSPVRHLNAVMDSEALRAAYNACLPKLSAYATEMGQNRFRAIRTIAEGPEYPKLDAAQRKIVDNALRDFRLAGVTDPEDQARYKAVQQELSRLASQFEENLLDATNGWHKHITDGQELAGMPDPPARWRIRRRSARDWKAGYSHWTFRLISADHLCGQSRAAPRDV